MLHYHTATIIFLISGIFNAIGVKDDSNLLLREKKKKRRNNYIIMYYN